MTTLSELIDELLKEINQVLEDTKDAYQTGKKLEKSYIDAGIKISEYSGGYKDGASNCIIKEHTDVWKISELAKKLKDALPQENKWQAETVKKLEAKHTELTEKARLHTEHECLDKYYIEGQALGTAEAISIVKGENKK